MPVPGLPHGVLPAPSADGRADTFLTPIQPKPPAPSETPPVAIGLCCGPSSSLEGAVAAGVVVVVVVMEVVAVVEVVVVSFRPGFQAQKMDREKLTMEESKQRWHCCPPNKFGDMDNPRAVAWHSALGKDFLLSILRRLLKCGEQGS